MQYHHQISQTVVIMERSEWKPNNVVDICPNCPRCGSSNTKFCYYNNYSLIQPRYFCKGCRRYWIKGGSLHNVPVGGGCRKHRDSSSGHHLDSANGESHIDLALVYANFLNNNPQLHLGHQSSNNKLVISKERTDIIAAEAHQEILGRSSGLIVDDSISIPSSSSNIQMLEGNCIGFFGWDSLSSHFKVPDAQSGFESPGSSIKDITSAQIYDHNGVSHDPLHNMHHAPLIIQQCSTDNNMGYFELPPLPGEGVAGSRETWSDPNDRLLVDQRLPTTELLTTVINEPADQAHQDPHVFIGSNSKEFDFSSDDTFLRK